jgi:chromosomal replication initiation ATPase DnaA
MIIFLVEDYSMRKFLEGVLPRLDFKNHEFDIKHHQGKGDLISNLDKIIPTLSKRAQQIIVIIDQDKQDCTELKNKIKGKMAWCSCEYKIRIACYELESWFLGDMEAIAKCSTKFKASFFQGKEKYRDIDSIHKPSSVIEEIVPDWKDTYSSKPKFAEKMAKFISLDARNTKKANRSHSFQVFLEMLQKLSSNTCPKL